MRIFIAEASGTIGSQPVACGHEVVGFIRSAAKISMLCAFGAEPPHRIPTLLAANGPVK